MNRSQILLFRFILVILVISTLNANLGAQNICYPFIKRQYFNNTEKVIGTRVFNSMTTVGLNNRGTGFWMSGHGLVNVANHVDGFLIRFDDTGKYVSSLRYGLKGTAANETVLDIASTPSAGAVVVGSSYTSSITATLGFVSYFTSNGKLKWTRGTSSSNRTGQSDIMNHVLVYDANTILVVGEGSQLTGKRNLIAAQLDSSGVTKWSLNVDMNNNEHHGQGIARVGNEWVITGWARSTQTYPFAVFVRNDGSIRKIWKGNSNGTNQFGHVIVSSGGTIYTVGSTGVGFAVNTLVCAFRSNGTRKWSRDIGTNNVVESGQHIYLEGGSLWASATSQTVANQRMLLFQIDTATGATIQAQKILSNGNANFTTASFQRNFDYRKKGGIIAMGTDNAAGIHNNFMINSPCNSACGSGTASAANAALTWTWDSSTYTAKSIGDLATVVFDTVSFYMTQTINCTEACPLPIKTIKSPLVICPSTSSVSTDATQALAESYSWDDGNTSPQRTFTTAGTFIVTSKNACGSRADSVVVGKTSPPVKPSLKDTLFCKSPFSYTLNVAQPFSKYVWDNGSTLSTRTFTKPGVFWLDTRNACGSRVDSVRFKILLPPVSPKLLDTALCIGKSVVMNFPKVPASLYLWPDGDTMVPKTFFGTQNVVLIVSNLCGVARDTFDVKLKFPPTKTKVKDTTFCSQYFAWDLNMSQTRVTNYLWENLATTPTRLITGTGKFWLTVSNECGGRTDTFNIFTDTVPAKRLVAEEWFCGGQQYLLKGQQFSGYSKYQWSTGAKTGNLSVSQSGNYVLHTYNACGERWDTVKVNSLRCDCHMLMPNAFTPFGSQGLNDEVRPIFVDDWGKTCVVKSGYWSVYNRWGECIFDKRPLTEAWNGIYMDEPVIDGIYVYIIHVIFDETVSGFRNMDKRGTIHVMDSKK